MVIDEIRIFIGTFTFPNPSTEVINLAFDSTRENDGLRVVFADFFVYLEGSSNLDPELPQELFILVIERYASLKRDGLMDGEVKMRTLAEEFGFLVGSGHWDEFPDYYQPCENLRDMGIVEARR